MRTFSFFYFNIYRYLEKEYPNEDPHRNTISDIWVPLGGFFSLSLLIVYIHFGGDIPKYMFESEPGKTGNKYDPSPLTILMFVPVFFLKKFLNWFYGRPNYIKKLKVFYLPNDEKTPTYRTLGILLFIFLMLYPLFNLVFYFWWGLIGLLPLLLFFICMETWIYYTFKWQIEGI